MFRKALALSTAAMLMVVDLGAANDAPVVKTNWAGFRQQVAERRLADRNVRISLVTGAEVKARLERIEENGVVVRSNAATKQWSSGPQEATVPRDAIASVRFTGKVGKGGLIGGLVGLGAGAAVAGAVAKSMEGNSCEGYICAAAAGIVPVAAVGGWLIGRATRQRAPTFLIQPDR